MSLDEPLARIEAYIQAFTGIKPESVGGHTWNRALRTRMAANHLTDPEAYVARLKRSRFELQELIELLVVAETWFFRDRAAFDFLVKNVQEKEAKGNKKHWRILSLACSTGEEPYSISMALSDAQIPFSRYTIEGVDISRKALEKAEASVYTQNSFRGKELLFRRSHFEDTNSGFLVNPAIKSRVKFRYGNVADSNWHLSRPQYDYIFCRNLLIYLSPEAQKTTLALCRRMLLPDGVLFLGPTEGELAKAEGFKPSGSALACAFVAEPKPSDENNELRPTPKAPSIVIQKKAENAITQRTKKQMLLHAKQLSEKGEVDTGISVCMEYMAKYGGDADCYFLLGMLQLSARREDQAEHYLQKSIYLDSKQYEALVNLALICERRGSKKQAELYWKRARLANSASSRG